MDNIFFTRTYAIRDREMSPDLFKELDDFISGRIDEVHETSWQLLFSEKIL